MNTNSKPNVWGFRGVTLLFVQSLVRIYILLQLLIRKEDALSNTILEVQEESDGTFLGINIQDWQILARGIMDHGGASFNNGAFLTVAIL